MTGWVQILAHEQKATTTTTIIIVVFVVIVAVVKSDTLTAQVTGARGGRRGEGTHS